MGSFYYCARKRGALIKEGMSPTRVRKGRAARLPASRLSCATSRVLLYCGIFIQKETFMKNDKHTNAIPSVALTQAQTKIDEIKLVLSSCMVPLTSEERHEMLKMGEKTLMFVEKAHDFAHQNPTLVPAYLDMDGFDVDFKDAHGLWALVNSVRQLYENLSDTEMAAGSEAYQAALVFYNSVKIAAAQDVPGAKAVYEELKTRFPQRRGRKASSESETATETVKQEISRS
jgi:hypothetical protein